MFEAFKFVNILGADKGFPAIGTSGSGNVVFAGHFDEVLEFQLNGRRPSGKLIAAQTESLPMKRLILCLSVCLMSLSNAGADTPPKAEAAAGRVYEMRTYYANPGKMTALHARFKDHTCRLFEKHGITLVGFWSPTDEKQAEDVMIYILSYPSKEAADKSWKAFREDPEWIKAKEASEKDGGLVKKAESLWLKGTPYSPLK